MAQLNAVPDEPPPVVERTEPRGRDSKMHREGSNAVVSISRGRKGNFRTTNETFAGRRVYSGRGAFIPAEYVNSDGSAQPFRTQAVPGRNLLQGTITLHHVCIRSRLCELREDVESLGWVTSAFRYVPHVSALMFAELDKQKEE